MDEGVRGGWKIGEGTWGEIYVGGGGTRVCVREGGGYVGYVSWVGCMGVGGVTCGGSEVRFAGGGGVGTILAKIAKFCNIYS